MNQQPEITVVVPCFNAEKHLAQTLQALQQQSFSNWTAVVIDDGSSDGTADIVTSFCKNDRRFELIKQINAGVSQARNKGIEKVLTPYIAFLDADDVWHPEFLDKMYGFMSSDPSRDIGFTRVRIVDENGRPTGASSKPKLHGLNVFDLLCSNPTSTTSNLFVRKSAFDRTGPFKAGLNHAEDQLWLLEAFLAGCKFEGLNEVLLDYRTNSTGLSSDLEAMRLGWETLCAEASARHPLAVMPLADKARALNLRYLARRALRLHPSSGTAGRYMARSLSADWTQIFTVPWPVWPLTAACLADTLLGIAMPSVSNSKSGSSPCQP